MFLQKRIGSAAPFCIVIVLLQQEITTKAFTSVTQDHFYSTNATRQISYFVICKGATFHYFDMKGCSIESKSILSWLTKILLLLWCTGAVISSLREKCICNSVFVFVSVSVVSSFVSVVLSFVSEVLSFVSV